ncbi:MAG: DUF6531 domain-containing protein [Candidatus Eremiobacteraeota bacterium]|nr:DUF6531 domain-containing protein [Candidatus Eremiobacteraeota bacterium]
MQFTAGTGINPWWRYQEENVAGGGRMMINVGTGNLLLQYDDMSVPHKGIALAFRRTYNSQSQHDVNGSDGSAPNVFGNGWTNTFDAHLSTSGPGAITVWDIDGAHYDYNQASDGSWTAPIGQHATLASDGGCGFLWTKKSGTTYYFWQPPNGPCTGSAWDAAYGAYDGRLYQIIGRNRNTYIIFGYSWEGGTAPGGKVSAISANTESGLTATLSFGDVSGHRLLNNLAFPDGTTVYYGYDAAGNLTWVSRPPNSAAGTRPLEGFGYASGGLMSWAASPRWNGPDGGALFYLNYSGTTAPTATVSGVSHFGVVNPSIPDGTGSVLQPGAPTGAVDYNDSWYGTGGSTPWFHDTDGHSTNWVISADPQDPNQTQMQTQVCTAMVGWSCTGTWLVSNEKWAKSTNTLTKEVDPRGNETDFLYDPQGNTTAVGEPYTATSQGAFKPTKLFDYDVNNNLIAYCDEAASHANGGQGDWTGAGPPTAGGPDALCATNGSSAHAVFTFPITPAPSYEPLGQLTNIRSPLGYNHAISYAATKQGGIDYGLPTSVTGDTFAQFDGPPITPTQTFWYDATGNLRCYSKGRGTWVLSYDTLGRMTSVADSDDTSANAGSLCAKSSGQPGWNTQTTKSYFSDGSLQTSQTPAERSFGVSTAYTYDNDGNALTETQHHGCVPNQSCPDGTTRKWYDGADRLVEVAQPHDPRSYVSPALNPVQVYDGDPWLTRYAYDLTQGGTVGMTGSAAFAAHGNLFKTQTFLSDTGWTDVRGSAFDSLDRETTKYSYSVTIGAHQLETTTLQYDLDAASIGLLGRKTNPSGESAHYDYDALGHVATETYAGDAVGTPTESYVYDPDGRAVSITSSQYGVQQYAYDRDGRMTASVEPSGGGVTDAAQISSSYYPNGTRSGVSVSSPTFTQPNALTYSYRTDGLLKAQSVNAFATGSWVKQYTDAGRLVGVTGADAQTRSYDAAGQLRTYSLSGGKRDLRA